MNETRVEAKRAPSTGPWQRLQRERALLVWFDAGQRKHLALRSARFYAFGVFVFYALAIAISGGREHRDAIHAELQAALTALSWLVASLAALGAARALVDHGVEDPLAALARQRGFDARATRRARTLSLAWRVARLIAIPAFLLVAVGLVRGARGPWALAIVPAIASYALVVGLVTASCALLAATLTPNRPRWLLLALLVLPWLLSQANPAFPTLPSVLSALLSRLLDAGARLS